MKNTPSVSTTPDLRKGIIQRAAQVLGAGLVQAIVLFLAAGKIAWLWGWAYVGIGLAAIAVNSVFLFRRNPETIAERGRAAWQKDWDKIVGGLWALMYYLVMIVVAGLDERLGWSVDLSLALQLIGLAGFALGLALFSWAMITNAYFSTVVRVQDDRGHTVCTSGPYRAVRHPGYVGAVLQTFAAPLLLGSLWALIPGGLAAGLMVLRTALEDRMLRAELAGYADYAAQVRYRLLPGIW